MLKKGVITKNISNLYTVNTSDGDYDCNPRGIFRFQKMIPVVGDHVDIETEGNVITNIYPRVNYSERPPVANAEFALIVTSIKKPDLSLSLLDKLITNFESRKIKPILCFTKFDLANKEDLKEVKDIMRYYKKIGYKILTNRNLFTFKIVLKNKIGFLVGQTGAGKSTLLNKLDKNLNLETKQISDALGRGVHTTRHTQLYKIANFYIADTPGFSAIDLTHIKHDVLKDYFVEFNNIVCEYKDCNHDKENCNVKKEVGKSIRKSRYDNYLRMYKEAYENRGKLFK